MSINSDIFKTYTIFNLMKIQVKLHKWTYRENEKINPLQKTSQDGLLYGIEVFDENNNLKCNPKKFVVSKVEGRI